MNTHDVRNMSVNQWVFWAVAVPVMFIIIILSLIWTNELDNFWNGFVNLWRRGRRLGTGRDYASMAPMTFVDRDRDIRTMRRGEREGRDLFGNRRRGTYLE